MAVIAVEDILSFSVNWLQIILMFRVLVVQIVTGSDKAESGMALSVAMEMFSKKGVLQYFNVKSAIETLLICSQMASKQNGVKTAEKSYSLRSMHTLSSEIMLRYFVSQATDILKRKQRSSVSELTDRKFPEKICD